MKRFPLQAAIIGIGATGALIASAWLVAPKATNAPQQLLEQAVKDAAAEAWELDPSHLDKSRAQLEQEIETIEGCMFTGEISAECQRLIDAY